MFLMYKDTKILYFDLNEFIVEVIDRDLMPFSIRSKIRNNNNIKDFMYNTSVLKSYLSSRVLSLSRKNAKQLYAMFGIPQLDDIETRLKICLKCKGVSIQDSYWVANDDETKTWREINIRTNKLKSIIDVSLIGNYPSVCTNCICPELTTKGLFPKGWVRDNSNNELYLLKTDDTNYNVNTRMEVLASKILSCTNIDSVEYTGRVRNTTNGKKYVNKSRNYVKEDFSVVEAWELIEYYKDNGVDFEKEALRKFKSKFANIPVIDFILMNTDRHTQNYAFKMNDNGEIFDVCPLFDFNLALVSDFFNKYNIEDTLSQMFNKNESIKSVMHRYIQFSNIEIDMEKLNKFKCNDSNYKYIYDRVLERIQYCNNIKKIIM